MFCCICFQILPVIDGFKHVALIAAESNKDVQLVKALIQNLLYVVYVSTFYERSLANIVILGGISLGCPLYMYEDATHTIIINV